jgi:hypothetical protein
MWQETRSVATLSGSLVFIKIPFGLGVSPAEEETWRKQIALASTRMVDTRVLDNRAMPLPSYDAEVD